MNKLINISVLLLMVSLLNVSCEDEENSRNYSKELKAEYKLIDEFIERQNIKVLEDFPADSVFQANEYVLTESGLYFQLISKGTGTDTAEAGDYVNIRYSKYSITEYPDTMRSDNINDLQYPTSFQFENTAQGCLGWHEAVRYMKRTGSKAKIINPSKLGFASDRSPVLVPYGYDISSIQIRKW